MNQSVVITGMGVTTPLGVGTSANWQALTRRGLTQQPHLNAPLGQTPLLHSDAPLGQTPMVRCGELLGQTPMAQAMGMAEQVVGEALEEACLVRGGDRAGCVFSASKPLFDGTAWVAPDVITDQVAAEFELRGERRNVIAACATGPYAVAQGARWILDGLCDWVVAGSVEPPAHPLIAAGFERMGVLSPDQMTRSFDGQRNGFHLAWGAGAVILESDRHAAARGAIPVARLSGWGLGSDPHSAVAFNSDGQHIADAIRRALERAALSPDSIGHVNAHGTGTKLNDRLETRALMKAFGAHAPKLKISGTKSSTGHLLGAAGSVELIWALLALRHQTVPPTRHLETPDPDCSLDYTPGDACSVSFDHALTLSFGFGGPIGALVVSRC